MWMPCVFLKLFSWQKYLEMYSAWSLPIWHFSIFPIHSVSTHSYNNSDKANNHSYHNRPGPLSQLHFSTWTSSAGIKPVILQSKVNDSTSAPRQEKKEKAALTNCQKWKCTDWWNISSTNFYLNSGSKILDQLKTFRRSFQTAWW